MSVLETARLRLRRLTPDDAAFIRRLLNEPSFIRYIGDRGVRSDADARKYIEEGPMDSYTRNGFGLYLVELKEKETPAGICGLLKREALDHVDVGFAFLPEFWSQGYALEAATVVLEDARSRGFVRVLAITSPDNAPSIGLLGKLGFRFERTTRLGEGATDVKVFARDQEGSNDGF
jgi:ribosomal-protein-alanine N-acetyltransferase